MFGENADTSLKKKAEKTGMPFGILKQVYNRGVAAWKSGHRPGTTPEQWGHARVNSFVTKSKGTWGGADQDLARKVRGEEYSPVVEESIDIKKQLKKVQKNELAWYNKANSTKFKTWDEYQDHLKMLVAFDLKAQEKRERKVKIQTILNDQKAALEVADESVIIESNTVTSNSD